MRTCHLAELRPGLPGYLLPTCKAPRLLVIFPGPLSPHQPSGQEPLSGSKKEEGYQTDVLSHHLGASQGWRMKILTVERKGKSDVPALGQQSEDSVLNKYLLNESVYVCQTPGTEMKDSTLPSQYL